MRAGLFCRRLTDSPSMKMRLLFFFLFAVRCFCQITNVNLGAAANDKSGDSLRIAFSKLNTNTAWLASQLGASTNSTAPRVNGMQVVSAESALYTTDPTNGYVVRIFSGTTSSDWTWNATEGGPDVSGQRIRPTNYVTGSFIRTTAWAASKSSVASKAMKANSDGELVPSTATGQQVDNTAMQVETVAAMRALTAAQINDGQLIQTGGRLSNGDGGGLLFRYVAGDTTATNLGTVFAFASGTGRMIWTGGNQIDVRAFGVVADDSTDSTTALDAAYSALASGAVSDLSFPAGTIITAGNSITPTSNFLLKLTGITTKANSAVDPYGSRLKLKNESTNSILTINLSTSYRVRPAVSGIYFDGNKAGATNGEYCVKVVGVVFPAYTSGGTWNNCAFNRGKLGGFYATNVFQFIVNNCNFQSNGGDGMALTGIGGDSHISSCVFEKSGRHGLYIDENQNTVLTRCEFAFSQDNGTLLEDSIGTVFLGCDWSYNGANGLEIKGNLGATTGTQNTYVIGGRMGLSNWGTPGDGGTAYASGTYSNLKLSGDSNPQGNHYFSGVQFYIPGGESNSTNKPKYMVEDARSNGNYTSTPGLGITFAGINIPTATNYFVTGRYTAGMETNSAWVGLGDHGTGTAYTLPDTTINSAVVNATLTVGASSATTRRLTVIGGSAGSDLMMLSRPGVADISFRLGTDALIAYSSNNAAAMFGGQYLSGSPILVVGHPSAQAATPPASSFIRSQQPTTGAGSNVAGGTLNIEPSAGTGNSTSNGDLNLRTPDATTSGTAVQALTTKVKLYRRGALAVGPAGISGDVSSAALFVDSVTLGFRPPVMTTAQRNAISSPATGLQVFCSDCVATDGSTGVSQTYSSGSWRNQY